MGTNCLPRRYVTHKTQQNQSRAEQPFISNKNKSRQREGKNSKRDVLTLTGLWVLQATVAYGFQQYGTFVT